MFTFHMYTNTFQTTKGSVTQGTQSGNGQLNFGMDILIMSLEVRPRFNNIVANWGYSQTTEREWMFSKPFSKTTLRVRDKFAFIAFIITISTIRSLTSPLIINYADGTKIVEHTTP